MGYKKGKKQRGEICKDLVAEISKLDAGWPGVIYLKVASSGAELLGETCLALARSGFGLEHDVYKTWNRLGLRCKMRSGRSWWNGLQPALDVSYVGNEF